MSPNTATLRRFVFRAALLLAALAAIPACHEPDDDPPPPPPPVYSVTTLSLPDGAVGTAYSQTLTAANGEAPYAWSLLSGTLPAGLSLNAATGEIGGTPSANGYSAFVVRATDALFRVANRALAITVSGGGASAPSITTTTLPDATQDVWYVSSASASGGLPPYAWTLSAGALPAGLSLDSGGFISGTPTATGTSSFTLRVADSTMPTPQTATRALSITVNAAVTISISSLPAGTQGAGYSQTLTVSNGSGPFVWTVAGGALPAGLSLNPTTGAITGTPTAAGSSAFTVQVIDANGAYATQDLSILMNVPVVVTTTTQPDWTQGHPYSQTLAATGGTLPYTNWTVTAGSLPGGLSLNPATGVLGGTPTVAGTFPFTVQVTDTAGAVDTQALTLLINPALGITTLTLPSWTINRPYSQTLAASGGTTPYTLWEVSAGALPTNVSLNPATGALTGTPTGIGAFSFTARVTDSVGATDTQSLSITINANPTVTTTTLPAWTINRPYSQTLAVADGTGPFTWSLLSGALPTGLSLTPATGVIDGTPTATGAASFSVQVTDSAGAVDTQALSILINPAPSIATSTLPDWTQGHPYSQTLAAADGTTPYTNWTISAGTQPAGLTLDPSTGVLGGTPGSAGSFTFTVQVTDTAGATAARPFTVVINPPVVITNASLPNWTINRTYGQTLVKTGGTGTVAWSVFAGTLPAGLTLNPGTGVLDGTPTVAATSTFTIRATDGVGATGDKSFTIVINPAPSVSTGSLPDWTQGHPYSQTLAAADGTTPYANWTITGGTQPAGLTLDPSTGVLSGTPTAASSFTFTVQVSDAAGATASKPFTIVVAAALTVTTASLPDWTQGHAYAPQTLAKSGGTGAVTWSVSAGTFPTGLALNSGTGVIDSTPTAAASYTFTILVTDSVGATGSKQFTVVIAAALTVTTASLPDWTVNVAYAPQTLAKSGGTGVVTWTVSAGTFPTGLALNSGTGVIDSTPTAAASYTFTILVTDSVGATGSKPFTVVINPAASVSTASLPDWTQGHAYSQTLVASGGTAPYTAWAITGGTQPTGLTLDPSTGVLSGTPTASASFTFTVQVTDSVGGTGSKQFTVVIAAALSVTTASLPDWTVNVAYAPQTLTKSGGTGAVTWTVSAGIFPTGLALNSGTGVIDNTPTAAASYTFTILVTDSVGATGSKQFTVVIAAALSVTTASLPDWTVNVAYAPQTLTKSGGTGAVTWSVSAGTFPTGLALDSGTGVIDNMPTAAASYTFTILVTDSVGATGSKQFTVVIAAALSITTASLPDWTVNVAYAPQTLAKSGGTGAVTWSVSAGIFPTGLALNSGTGLIDNTPTAAASYTFTILVTDSVGATGSKQFTIVIAAALTVTTASLPDWTVNVAYAPQTLVKSGGTGAVTWTVSAGIFPTGLALNSGTGVIDNTPTAAATYTFTILVTDSVGATGSKQFTVVIAAALSITTASLPDWTQGQAYAPQTLAKSGGTGAVTWSVSAGTFPTGLALNSGTGVIDNTPTAAASYTFTVLATDSVGATGSKQFTIVMAAALTVTTASLPDWTVNVAYAPQTLAKSGGTGAVTWTVSAGTFPTGLALNTGTGVIDSTPTAAASYTFTILVTDSVGATGSKQFTVAVNPAVVVTTASLPDGTQGQPYSQTLAASGGTGILAWTVEAPTALPAGLTFSSGGTISGTPTGSGSTSFTVRATDAVGGTDTQALSIFVVLVSPVITTPALPAGTVGVYYSAQLTAANGTPAYTWSNTAPLPAWMSLDPATGVLSGTPPASGPSTIDLQVTDSLGSTGTQSFSHFVRPPSAPQGNLSIATGRLPDAVVGAPYSGTLYAVGGTSPYAFTLDPTGIQFPASLTLGASGTITGTPLAGEVGQYTVSVRATDVAGGECAGNVALLVRSAAAALSVTTASLPAAAGGASYGPIQLAAAGGVPPYLWEIAEDAGPPVGLLFTRTGLFYGNTRIAGVHTIKVRVFDSANPRNKAVKSLSLSVGLPPPSEFQVTTTSLPAAQLGVPYGPLPVATNGVDGPVSAWIVSPGLQEVGLNFNYSNGTVFGTPTATGNAGFFVGASSSGTPRKTAGAVVSLVVGPASPTALHITTLSLPDILPNEPYSQFLQVANATGAVTWSQVSGTLPGGITLDPATGEISGSTSGSLGGETYVFSANDGTSTTQAVVQLSSLSGLPEILGAFGFGGGPEEPVLPPATEGVAYSQIVDVWNANRDETSLRVRTGASLPAGLALDPARRKLSGTPTVPGRYLLELGVRENQLREGMSDEPFRTTETSAFLEVFRTTGFRIAKRVLHAGREGAPHGAETLYLEGSPGSTPYTFTVTSGALPPGLVLDPANGTITGTPTRAGRYRFMVQAAQGAATCSMAYELPIDPALPFGIETDRLPTAHQGVAYEASLVAYGASGPVTWSDSGSPTPFGSLGIVLNSSTGALTAPPVMSAADGLYTVRVTATNGANVSVREVSILIENVPLAFSRFGHFAFVNHAHSDAVVASGGSGNYGYALAPGEILPPGLSMDAAGALTGTPTVAGIYYGIHVRITDATSGRTGSGRLFIMVKSDDFPALGWQVEFDQVEGELGVMMSKDLFALGGFPDYLFTIAPAPPSDADDLVPPGLTLSTAGPSPNHANFSGIPTSSGEYAAVINATDGAFDSADFRVEFRIRSNSMVLRLETERVPEGSASAAYPATPLYAFTSAGNPLSWSSTTLPAGLGLDPATGEISSASPLTAGTHYFFVTVTDTVTGGTTEGRVRLVIAP